MKKEMQKIRVIDIPTEHVLFECSLQESEKAYEFAAEMEKMGLDLKVIVPTLSQTLSHTMGLSREAQAEYEESIEEEMDDHDGSCCFTKDDLNKTLN